MFLKTNTNIIFIDGKFLKYKTVRILMICLLSPVPTTPNQNQYAIHNRSLRNPLQADYRSLKYIQV